MTRYILSNTFVLATFILSFWPIARRAGRHARIWLLGWTFILFHNIALLASEDATPHSSFVRLCALWGIELCGLCFIRAAGSTPIAPIRWPFLLEMAVPILLQSALSVFEVNAYPLRLLTALLLFGPGIHVLAWRESRTRPLIRLALGFAALGVVCLKIAHDDASVATAAILSVLFLSAAFLSFVAAPRVTRGVIIAGAGLAAWGLTYPLTILFARFAPSMPVDPAVLDLPQYAVACGMILTLLEEHLSRTEQLARVDPLTGLPNTRHFEDRFAHALTMASAHGNPIACMVIDVDRFKHINDTLGHPVGDELLKALAVRLAWHIGPRDTLARTGGDEFIALLVSENDEHHLHFIARAMMSAASVPVSVQGHSVVVTMSVGIAISTEGNLSLPVLRKAADDAMYEAKRKGGGMLVVAEPIVQPMVGAIA